MIRRLCIAHLYPEQMNIYGDRGNIIAMVQRCRWRGIEATVLPVGTGSTVDWDAVDIAFFGGGQDSGQALIAADFTERHGAAVQAAVEHGLVMLAICGGYQLLGHYFITHVGERLPGAGVLDVHTIGGPVRMIGNVAIQVGAWAAGSTSLAPGTRLVGFENHSGRTYLGSAAQPLGQVLVGNGNNAEDGSEGAIYRNVFGCYLHGSLLPKNPQLTDHLISLAMMRRYGVAALDPLDDTIEVQAQHAILERLIHVDQRSGAQRHA